MKTYAQPEVILMMTENIDIISTSGENDPYRNDPYQNDIMWDLSLNSSKRI